MIRSLKRKVTYSSHRVKEFIHSYKPELVISIVTVILTLLISIALDVYLPYKNPIQKVMVIVGLIIIFLLLSILFNLKRFIEKKFRQINHILIEQFGFTSQENEYYRRRRHFIVEKDLLADIFVIKELPKLFKDKIQHKFAKVIILLDSGTTITPIFLKLMKYGIPEVEKKKVVIYTNNLAGIDEIQKPVNTKFYNLQEKNFNIIAGTPLKTYRAITGDVTQKFLETNIWTEYENSNNVIVSVVTGNWILAGSNLNEISHVHAALVIWSLKRNLLIIVIIFLL